MGCGSDDVGMRKRRRVLSCGDKACDVCHIDHEESPDGIGDFTEFGEVDDARISGCACEDELGFMGLSKGEEGIVIDESGFFFDSVEDGIEPFSGDIGSGSMREVSAGIEVEAEVGIAWL